MKIPIPCKFGEKADCEGKVLPFVGVAWFRWLHEMEYTYFFATNNFWNTTSFYTSTGKNQPYTFTIQDGLLEDRLIKDHGYPLRGKGHASGICYKEGKTYLDFVITSGHYQHIEVQCDDKGNYIPNGNIIFPPTWDDEKKENAILKKFELNQKGFEE